MLEEIICKRVKDKGVFYFDIVSSKKLNTNELNHLVPTIHTFLQIINSFCSYSKTERKRFIDKMNREKK